MHIYINSYSHRPCIDLDPETAIIGVDKSTYSPVKERLEREYEKNNGLVPQFYSQWLIELGEKNSHENSYEWIRYLLKQKRISTVYVEHETLVTHLNQGKRFAKKERGEALIASVMLKNGYRWDSTKVALVRGVTGWQRTKHLTLALIFLSMIVASIYTIFKHISGG